VLALFGGGFQLCDQLLRREHGVRDAQHVQRVRRSASGERIQRNEFLFQDGILPGIRAGYANWSAIFTISSPPMLVAVTTTFSPAAIIPLSARASR